MDEENKKVCLTQETYDVVNPKGIPAKYIIVLDWHGIELQIVFKNADGMKTEFLTKNDIPIIRTVLVCVIEWE